jgi:putative sigma-54 modulation protein
MDVQIKTQNVRLTDGQREHIQERVSKLERVHENPTDVKLEVRSVKPRSGGEQFVVQFTIAVPGNILRTEVQNHDLLSAADQAIAKMERQIRRYRDRKIDRGRRGTSLSQLAIEQNAGAEATEDETVGRIVRTKRFDMAPMDTDEAIEQLELLGHDFFVFFNPDTSQVNVVYRRRDGNYGLIEPEIA